MASKKRKNEEQLMEEIKGLPYSDNIKKILDYVVLGLCFLCLLSLLFPIIRFWRTLSDSLYAEYFVSGYAFIFGGEIKDVAKENSSNVLEVTMNVRYLLTYIFTILSCGVVGLGYLQKTKKYKKFLRLISSLLFVVAFVLIFNYNSELLSIVRNTGSNYIREVAFTFYGIVFLVSLALGALVMLYQACCEKIVKN
jgi:hypothetical protein